MEAAALACQAARALCAAAPEHPAGQEQLALLVPGVDPARLRQGLQLARQLRSPYWTCMLAYGVSMGSSWHAAHSPCLLHCPLCLKCMHACLDLAARLAVLGV